MHPGELTRIRATFNLKAFAAPQEYVFHCHILMHEDSGMMAVVEVVE